MYLVTSTVHTPGWQVGAMRLTESLASGATQANELEHVYVAFRPDYADVVLFLLATDRHEAALHANQLLRRAMAFLADSRPWQVVAVRVSRPSDGPSSR
ncbi:hypothetical protein ACF07Z_28550 [Streptomyces albidoflavus]